MSIQAICGIIEALRGTKSRKEKLNILRTHKENKEFLCVLQWAYDPFRTYGVKNFPAVLHQQNSCEDGAFTALQKLLDSLAARSLTGAIAQREIQTTVSTYGEHFEALLRGILNKDLDCGVQAKTLNLVLGKDFVPIFDVQLATSSDSYPLPIYAEEKHDGVRMLCFYDGAKVSFFTRAGQHVPMPSLETEVTKHVDCLTPRDFNDMGTKGIVLDGEITGVDRQSVSGLVNRLRLEKADRDYSDSFTFTLFDTLTLKEWEEKKCGRNNRMRREWLETTFSALFQGRSEQIKLGEARLCHTVEDVDAYYAKVISKGGEGLILKPFSGLYEWKRSKAWIKLKEVKECDLLVVDTQDGEGKRFGGIGSLICQSSCKQLVVKVGSGFSDEMIADMNRNNPVGKVVTVRYNVLSHSNTLGVPKWSLFLPRFVEFREDKSVADTLEDIKNG